MTGGSEKLCLPCNTGSGSLPGPISPRPASVRFWPASALPRRFTMPTLRPFRRWSPWERSSWTLFPINLWIRPWPSWTAAPGRMCSSSPSTMRSTPSACAIFSTLLCCSTARGPCPPSMTRLPLPWWVPAAARPTVFARRSISAILWPGRALWWSPAWPGALTPRPMRERFAPAASRRRCWAAARILPIPPKTPGSMPIFSPPAWCFPSIRRAPRPAPGIFPSATASSAA